MRARLFTKKGVYAPPAIYPNRDPQVFQFGIEADYVGGNHTDRFRQPHYYASTQKTPQLE
jgi:hypothetical protein